ncbi:uncharacterized protein BT62DRAFT_1011318 [Guyanagaster necrorhizus]|uniref:Uncharacterized protein n=1 Tax=Guyanagaster necrorhizus TaxID=856835 RepID=A0A9P7VKQ1_9AGAR|nr:uncharacterized protein BT62DRAFT_1011318 [Guyanagaster necrorhizus MCA 3950]KAG7441746.1 hypothetical protein BT62DRAFT_1011318 [Guyanagaster necrorhizus MCA 3950]
MAKPSSDDGSHANSKQLYIFNFTSLRDAWLQARSKTLTKRASRFIAPIFGAHPPLFLADVDHASSFALTPAQLLTFSYTTCVSLKNFILIKTHFFDYTPGVAEIDPDTGRRLLEVDEWVERETIRRRSVCCLGCLERFVFAEREFDVRGWQKHRDVCTGIEDMMWPFPIQATLTGFQGGELDGQ